MREHQHEKQSFVGASRAGIPAVRASFEEYIGKWGYFTELVYRSTLSTRRKG
jgi:hypothetical protein